MMNIDLSAQCFAENLSMFHRDQEKYNLYKGLEYMALMVKTLLIKVEHLEGEVLVLRRGH